MINIIGWVVWTLAAAYALGLLFSQNPDAGVRSMTRTQGFIILLGVVVTLVFSFSKLHLVWVVVIAFIAPMFLMQSRASKITRRVDQLAEESKKTGKPLNELLDAETKRLNK